MVKKQRFTRAMKKNFQRRFRHGDAPANRDPCGRIFPGIKLALPAATVSSPAKRTCAMPAGVIAQARQACSDSLARPCTGIT
ncbi:hypothetical protein F506_03900 [Herbaspirillum hiltneri N3]|uniref:Uncharacterized protein n=1 Tax=Herbaspirillum hiltneri N3 TaxID=1262470 RepID=A0ABN4HTG8_9BURK|nr:hypothetical protein F506_03900 [Herbaspirillum hiltneri N3]